MTKDDIKYVMGLSTKEIDEALIGLITKGLLIEFIGEDGESNYGITDLAVAFYSHMDSDPDIQN